MLKSFKNAALYISAIIGAGFATGSEIALFFGEQSIVIILLAGIMLGSFAGAFLRIGNIIYAEKPQGEAFDFFDIFPGKSAAFLRAVFLIASFVTLAAMTAGAERIFETVFKIKYAGVISLIPAVLCGLLNIDKIKSLFSALVAVTVALIFYLYVNSVGAAAFDGGGHNILKAVAYVSMNVFLGGYLIVKKEKSDKKEIILTAVFSALILTALLVMIYGINGGSTHEMPVIEAAAAAGRERIAAGIVLLSIFSTMISTAKTLFNRLLKKQGKFLAALSLVASAFFVSLAGFKNIVDYAYPVISLFSSVFTALTIIFLVKHGKAKKQSFFAQKKIVKSSQIVD
ncbi:MAG: hypothetical protein LBT30_05215 [Clostridiales bacterium]|jgi:uncharacterized membrane protein YkvI|nr:hypothetical protein [Clostridiales bacterium]